MKLLYKPRKRTNITEESQVIEKAKKDFIRLMNTSSFAAQISYVDSFLRIAFSLGWLDKYRELVQGCIADRFDIDGKPACDMSVEELKTVFSKVCEYIMQLPQEQPYNLQNALYNLVETFAPYEHSEDACECCGDFIETYTLEINSVPITEEWLAKNDFKKEYSPIVEYYSYKRLIDGYYVDIQFGCSNMGDDYVNCHIDNCDRCTVASADIQYVHQLQNLLNIMNIKFDIVL